MQGSRGSTITKLNLRITTQTNLFFLNSGARSPVVPYETEITIPKKFQYVNLEQVYRAGTKIEELFAVLKKVHPWSSLHYGLSALDVVRQLYQEWIPKYYGNCEIQILSPMTRGSLGTISLNKVIQETANPYVKGKRQLKVGEKNVQNWR